MHIGNFNPAITEGGFPVTLQGLGTYSLTNRVSPQFFGLSQVPETATVMEVAKSKQGMAVLAIGGVAGLAIGYFWGKSRRGY